MTKALARFLLICGLVLTTSGCESGHRERPYGTIKIGKYADYVEPEMYLTNLGLMLRRDSGGYSAMSTYSTIDLYPLVRKKSGDSYIFTSEYDSSTFAADGKVLTGPARHDLPYYRLYIDQEVVDTPEDTLFVRIGEEVPKNWRLAPARIE